MTSQAEINRLLEIMPASGRMYCKIVPQQRQRSVIAAKMPRPGQENRPILINFDLWAQLTEAQRDLLLLRTVSWLNSIRWVKPDLYQGLFAVGATATLLELLQWNAAATVTLGGLTALAGSQIWRKNRSTELEIAADEKAIQVAQRRGYTEPQAVSALIAAIEHVAEIEGRLPSLTETQRCQNLRALTYPLPMDAVKRVRPE